jgi:putative flippase GtrA
MKSLVEKAGESRFLIFNLVGLANTCIGYAIFALIYTAIELNYNLALLLAYLFGIFISYFAHRCITFKSTLGHREAFSRFFVAYLLLYLFNVVMLTALTDKWAIDPLLGQALCVLLVNLISFIVQNSWVFGR